MSRSRYAVYWTTPALEDLLRVVDYIRQDNPAAARRMYAAIRKRTGALAVNPRIGRIVPEFNEELRRELIHAPYRIIYSVIPQERRVEIRAVVHSARLMVQ